MRQVAVVVGDIVNSRGLGPEERGAVQRHLRGFAESDEALGFRWSGGDEFEWVLDDSPRALDRVLLLRISCATRPVPVRLTVGIGRGPITVEPGDNPYGGDGPAYHRARAAIRTITERRATRKRPRRRRGLRPSRSSARSTALRGDAESAPRADALLLCMDAIMDGWSPPQWEAIAGVVAEEPYGSIASRLGISVSAVGQRIRAAGLDLYLEGHDALRAEWERL